MRFFISSVLFLLFANAVFAQHPLKDIRNQLDLAPNQDFALMLNGDTVASFQKKGNESYSWFLGRGEKLTTWKDSLEQIKMHDGVQEIKRYALPDSALLYEAHKEDSVVTFSRRNICEGFFSKDVDPTILMILRYPNGNLKMKSYNNPNSDSGYTAHFDSTGRRVSYSWRTPEEMVSQNSFRKEHLQFLKRGDTSVTISALKRGSDITTSYYYLWKKGVYRYDSTYSKDGWGVSRFFPTGYARFSRDSLGNITWRDSLFKGRYGDEVYTHVTKRDTAYYKANYYRVSIMDILDIYDSQFPYTKKQIFDADSNLLQTVIYKFHGKGKEPKVIVKDAAGRHVFKPGDDGYNSFKATCYNKLPIQRTKDYSSDTIQVTSSANSILLHFEIGDINQQCHCYFFPPENEKALLLTNEGFTAMVASNKYDQALFDLILQNNDLKPYQWLTLYINGEKQKKQIEGAIIKVSYLGEVEKILP